MHTMKTQLLKKLFEFCFITVLSVFTIVFYNSCQKEKNTLCVPPVPTGLVADSISTSSARLSATPIPSSYKIIFKYKPVTDSTWFTANSENPNWIYSLMPETAYEYYAVASCTQANATPPKISVLAYFTTPKGCNCRERPRPPGCGAACGP
jgi:hypothetical protein